MRVRRQMPRARADCAEKPVSTGFSAFWLGTIDIFAASC
jgi:hypothetical protein